MITTNDAALEAIQICTGDTATVAIILAKLGPDTISGSHYTILTRDTQFVHL